MTRPAHGRMRPMKPYYEDEFVTLYHGDAVDLMRSGLAVTIDAVVDPSGDDAA